LSIASSLSFLQDVNGAITTSTFNAGAAPVTFSVLNNLRIEIDSNGYLLINTATSYGSYNLQVNGNAYITGGLTVTTATIGTIIGTVTSATSAQNITFSVDSGSATQQYLAFVSSNAGGVLSPKTYANLTYVPSTGLLSVGSLSVSGASTLGSLTVSGATVHSGTTNLGAVGNITITGGTSGQYLSTNGAGGLSWATVTSGGGGASVTISDSAPVSSSAGNLWWDSSVGNLAIYYVDTAGGQWVDAVSSYVFPSTVNNLIISTATQATSTTTGALVVTGGAGIGGNLYVGGGAASTSTTTGALVVTGGVGISGNLNVAGTITSNQLTVQYTTITNVTIITTDVFTLTNTTTVVSTTTGALVVTGGVGIGGGLFVGGAITATSLTLLSGGETDSGILAISNTASSTSTTTGALTVTGGVGIGGNLNLGGSLNIGTTLLVNGVTLNPVTISDSAPATPAAGQLWWDSNVGNLAIYYVDIAGGQWVDAVSSYVFPSSVNNLSITTSTQSASTTTGALVVAGGVGVGGAVYINTTSFIANSQIITTATIGSYAASSTGTTGTFLISNLTTATYNIANTSTGATTGTGALTVQGGVFISNTASAAIQLSATTASNTVTAALIVAGGAYIGGSIVVGGSTRNRVTTAVVGTGTYTMDCNLASVWQLTCTGTVTLSFINTATSGTQLITYMYITNSGGTIGTWPSGTLWPNGQAPTMTVSTSKTDIVSMSTINGGATWYGVVVSQSS